MNELERIERAKREWKEKESQRVVSDFLKSQDFIYIDSLEEKEMDFGFQSLNPLITIRVR